MQIDFKTALEEENAMNDIYAELAADEDRQNEELKNPEEALKFMDQMFDEDFDDFYPIEVLEVTEVVSNYAMTTSNIKLSARVLCNDQVERSVVAKYDYWSGNRMNPPEEDGWLEWE
jgi:hypothetical protein